MRRDCVELTTKRLLEMGVNRAATDAVQALQLSGGPKVVALNP